MMSNEHNTTVTKPTVTVVNLPIYDVVFEQSVINILSNAQEQIDKLIKNYLSDHDAFNDADKYTIVTNGFYSKQDSKIIAQITFGNNINTARPGQILLDIDSENNLTRKIKVITNCGSVVIGELQYFKEYYNRVVFWDYIS